MKTQILIFKSAITLLLLFSSQILAQVTNVSHAGSPTEYIGWQLGTNLNLDIVNEDPFHIKFFTDAGSGTLNNLRMFIEGNTGRVGIGNFASANTILHVHESAANTEAEISISNNATGNTTLDGFRIGSFADNSVLFRLYEDARIDFGTDITSFSNYISFQSI